MDVLKILHTDDTPGVDLDPLTGKFSISGRSLPEDAQLFYTPVFKWVSGYMERPAALTSIVFHFEYISTSSAKQLSRFFEMMNLLKRTNKVSIEWKSDKGDADMQQTGKRLQKLSEVQFSFTEA